MILIFMHNPGKEANVYMVENTHKSIIAFLKNIHTPYMNDDEVIPTDYITSIQLPT